MTEHTSLTLEEYRRYGRQMILRGFGLPGESPRHCFPLRLCTIY